ncbi:MAG: hypothetical protein LUG12_03325 [Erysipelotrichaceae bacterium]|nr:hypothetical protein [Erysipelotrichaceae bacterium]
MIYHISVGIAYDFVDTVISKEEDINSIQYMDASQIHILVQDITLYNLVIDKINSLNTNVPIITIAFNHDIACDYTLTNKYIQLKHYILPDRYHLDKQIQSTLVYKLNQYNIAFNEIDEFMNYLGIDQKHLRENLSSEELYNDLFLGEYHWQDVFGRQPKIDLLKYLQECEQRIQNHFKNKQNTIIQRFVDVIDEVLKQYFNDYTYIYVLNPHNSYSLYQLILQMSHMNMQRLLNMNKETSESFKEKYEETKTSRSLFSHKEEKFDDLLQTLDMLIAQRYEINRFKSMKAIYDQILAYLKEIQISYPQENYDYHIPIDFYDVFISRFMETKEFNCYQDFIDYSSMYQQLFKQYDYQIIVSNYQLENGIICLDMLENECEIYI